MHINITRIKFNARINVNATPWLSTGEKDNKTIKDLTPAEYKFLHLPRKNRRGDDIGLVYQSSFKVVVNRRDHMKSCEFVDVDVSSSGNSMKLVIIYCPPPSKKNKHSYADFLIEFVVSLNTTP